ncbi:KdsC family phosphatase [Cyanobium sp. ATX-6F1]|uniref:KdsC family phosphatase n=1 Tax=Cyanobium sp. ATX-6F1 TaxID=3137388 RepID=UPI0039BEC5D8
MIRRRDLSTIRIIFYDFDGVFTDNHVLVDSNGIEHVRCSRLDGFGISRLRSMGVLQLIVSTEINPVVSRRAEKLLLPVHQSVEDKAEVVAKVCAEHGILLEHAAFVGNDINDIDAMKAVGIAFAVADAFPQSSSMPISSLFAWGDTVPSVRYAT